LLISHSQSESCSGVQMPMEERMPQCKLTLVPGVFALALVSVSWVTSTGAVHASEKCLTAPNAPAHRDEHWYYRTDRATNRQCWYLARRDATVRKRTTEEKLSGPQLPLPQAPSRTPWPNGTAPDGNSDGSEPAANVPAPDSTVSWPEPGKWLDVPPSFERETPRSTDPIGLTAAPASGRTDRSHAATPVQVAAEGPSPAIVITLALLALFGPTYHTVRWVRRRKARDRWNTERPYTSALNEFDTDTDRRLNTDSTEQIAETLQQLLNEMQTKLYAAPDAVGSAERELHQNPKEHTDLRRTA
jgi:hypothetical protein